MKLQISLSLVIVFFMGHQICGQNGSDVLKKMHFTYFEGPCKSYTFSQKNTHYKGDTISGYSVWHEEIEFPDKFRIDFGERSDGNYVVFKNDSVFNFRKNVFIKSRPDSNTLLLILGGMYYRTFEDVVKRLKAAAFDIDILSLQKWNTEEIYVLGAREGDMHSNQIWVNKKTLQVERILEKMNATDMMDMRFEAHQAWCKGSVETKVSFRRNGKLEQVEEYYDLKEIKPLRH